MRFKLTLTTYNLLLYQTVNLVAILKLNLPGDYSGTSVIFSSIALATMALLIFLSGFFR